MEKKQKDNAELLFKFDLNSGRSSKKHLVVYGLESASYITLSSSSNQELESRSWAPEYRFSGSNLFWSPIQKDVRDRRPAAAHTFNILLHPLPWQLLSLYVTSQYESSLLLTQLHYYTTSSSSWKLATSTIYSWKWAIFHVPRLFPPPEMVRRWLLQIRATTLWIRDNKRYCCFECPFGWAEGLTRRCQKDLDTVFKAGSILLQ